MTLWIDPEITVAVTARFAPGLYDGWFVNWIMRIIHAQMIDSRSTAFDTNMSNQMDDRPN
jgi:hypothetical protein